MQQRRPISKHNLNLTFNHNLQQYHVGNKFSRFDRTIQIFRSRIK